MGALGRPTAALHIDAEPTAAAGARVIAGGGWPSRRAAGAGRGMKGAGGGLLNWTEAILGSEYEMWLFDGRNG